MPLRRIAYLSRAAEPFSKRALLDLLHDARGYNAADGITGLLIHSQGRFLQVLEGEPEALADLLQRLRRDPRHSDLHVLFDDDVEQRLFATWSMGCANFDDPALSLLPGLRTDLGDPAVVAELLAALPTIRDALGKLLD